MTPFDLSQLLKTQPVGPSMLGAQPWYGNDATQPAPAYGPETSLPSPHYQTPNKLVQPITMPGLQDQQSAMWNSFYDKNGAAIFKHPTVHYAGRTNEDTASFMPIGVIQGPWGPAPVQQGVPIVPGTGQPGGMSPPPPGGNVVLGPGALRGAMKGPYNEKLVEDMLAPNTSPPPGVTKMPGAMTPEELAIERSRDAAFLPGGKYDARQLLEQLNKPNNGFVSAEEARTPDPRMLARQLATQQIEARRAAGVTQPDVSPELKRRNFTEVNSGMTGDQRMGANSSIGAWAKNMGKDPGRAVTRAEMYKSAAAEKGIMLSDQQIKFLLAKDYQQEGF